jgi:hypothetical protein
MVKKNKKGWMKIVEAFLAILLLMGILLVILGGDEVKFEKGKLINQAQADFLHNIQINNSFRIEVLQLNNLPINSNDTGFPSDLKSYFLEEFQNCFMNICLPFDECTLDFETKGEIYSKEILINSYANIYSPKKVKIICYEDEI